MTTTTHSECGGSDDVQGFGLPLTAPVVAGMLVATGAAGVVIGATAAVAGIAVGNAIQSATSAPKGPKVAPGT